MKKACFRILKGIVCKIFFVSCSFLFRYLFNMCTVTLVPVNNNDFILTSNRDEAPNRMALVPDFYSVNGTKLLFPKDELSGGTWIGVSEKNRLICVLNGGFVAHKRKEKYRKSRGVVAKDYMIAKNIEEVLNDYDLDDIEPCTMIIVDWNTNLRFYELVWDGKEKHVSKLPLEPKIWSSSTLYNEQMKAERENWFNTFKIRNGLDANSIKAFHKGAGGYNLDYGVIMDRGFVKTTSITQVKKTEELVYMFYESLQDNVVANQMFTLPQVINE